MAPTKRRADNKQNQRQAEKPAKPRLKACVALVPVSAFAASKFLLCRG